MKHFKFIISGGGTGGHIYPALAIASGIKKCFKNSDILFVGAKGKMEMENVPKAGFPIKGLWISGFQRSFSVQNLLFPFKLIISLINSFCILRHFKPDIVVGTGGFASGPILKVAQWLGLPTLIQEQNSYPGITNKILAKRVDRICVAYKGMDVFFPKDKICLTGNPVRSYLTKSYSSKKAKRFFGLNHNKKVLAVIGGSLGAKRINELIQFELKFFKKMDLQVLWQCGSLYHETCKIHQSDTVVVKPFFYKMEKLYAAADFIISRAGATSISELCCIGKPLILIPSPNVTANHQFRNAKALLTEKAAVLIQEKELDLKFKNCVTNLVTKIDMQKELKNNLKRLGKPYATQTIVNEIQKIL